MYCTFDDLEHRFGFDELLQLTDKNRSGVIDKPVVEAALQDASDFIDGHLQGRYSLPLAKPPKVLTQLCANLARYSLHDHTVPDTVEKRYLAAKEFLAKVGAGQLSLGLSADDTPQASTNVIEITSDEQVFSRSNSKGFI